MSKPTQTVAFANFNLRFGPKLALVDLWQEIVYPAFKHPLVRETKAANFHITDVELLHLDKDLFIVGRFVKDTRITREQIFKDGELISAIAQLDAAFSSRFVLKLSTHSLIWAPETRLAPSLASFHATIAKSLGYYWKKHLENTLRIEYPSHKRTERKVLRAKLMERFPPPVLDIVAYPSERSVSDFLSTIALLTEVTYRIVDPNPHYDGADTSAMLLGMKQSITAKTASLRFNDADGLDKEVAAEQIADLTGTGIVDTRVRGKGVHGEDITGDAETMQVKVHVDQLPESNIETAKILNDALDTQQQSGAFKLGTVTDHVRAAIAGFILSHFPAGN